MEKSNIFQSLSVLVGTIIGVGLFTLPYITVRSGVWTMLFYFLLLSAVTILIKLIYGEIVLRTKDIHRLPGYVGKYYGPRHKKVALIIVLIAVNLSILAYIIFGGIFLHQLLSPAFGGDVFAYATILFIIEALIVFFGLKLIASVEFAMMAFLFLVIGLIIWRGWGEINISNYHLFDWQYAILPYGPIFFAIDGGAAIPEVCKLLANKKADIKSAIFWGTFISVIITLIFAVFIIGITGNNTSPDTLSGLSFIFNNGVIKITLVFGLLAIFTSLLITMQSAREIYRWDMGINNNLSWLLAGAIPYFLYVIGFNNTTKVVGLAGAIIGSLIGIIYILLALSIKKKAEQKSIIKNKINKGVAYGLALFLILGLICELWEVFN